MQCDMSLSKINDYCGLWPLDSKDGQSQPATEIQQLERACSAAFYITIDQNMEKSPLLKRIHY